MDTKSALHRALLVFFRFVKEPSFVVRREIGSLFFTVRDYSKGVIKQSNDGDDGEITITQESKRLDIVINSVALY